MSSSSLQAYEVMDLAAPLMNDAAKVTYTYSKQIPYLNMALAELQERFQLNNISITNQTTSDPIDINIGVKEVGPIDGIGKQVAPNYPVDLVEIRGIYERLQGSTDPWIRLSHRDFLPHTIDDLPTDSLMYWIWESQRIKFIGATTPREIKLDYVRTLFPKVVNASQHLGVINAQTFLMYKTAALMAHFCGENKTRSDELNALAETGIDRALGIGNKARQSIVTRRKPFMASYKRRSFS